MSRSATVVTAYLMHSMNLSFADALALLRQHHPEATPNAGFRQQLLAFEGLVSV